LALTVGGDSTVADDQNNEYRLVGHEELGWVPYSTLPIVSVRANRLKGPVLSCHGRAELRRPGARDFVLIRYKE
jgi:hypothetical protein